MAAKNLGVHVPLKGVIVLVILLLIAGVSFGSYVGRHQKTGGTTAVMSDWETYKSSEGWQIKHPPHTTISPGDQSPKEVQFGERLDYGTTFNEQYPGFTSIGIGFIKKPADMTFDQWVSKWVEVHQEGCDCGYTVSGGNNGQLPFISNYKNKNVFAGIEVVKEYETTPYPGSYPESYIFIPLNDQTILWSKAFDQEDTKKLALETLNTQREMIVTFTMPGIIYPPTPIISPAVSQ